MAWNAQLGYGRLQPALPMAPRVPPPRPAIEHLSTDKVNQEVPNILKIALERVGAFLSYRMPAEGIVTLYACHASNFVDGLSTRLPKEQLSRASRINACSDTATATI